MRLKHNTKTYNNHTSESQRKMNSMLKNIWGLSLKPCTWYSPYHWVSSRKKRKRIRENLFEKILAKISHSLKKMISYRFKNMSELQWDKLNSLHSSNWEVKTKKLSLKAAKQCTIYSRTITSMMWISTKRLRKLKGNIFKCWRDGELILIFINSIKDSHRWKKIGWQIPLLKELLKEFPKTEGSPKGRATEMISSTYSLS